MVNSTNHYDIVWHKASHECVYLDRMIYHILKLCGVDSIESIVITYKGNTTSVV